jgi:hypothetical protein
MDKHLGRASIIAVIASIISSIYDQYRTRKRIEAQIVSDERIANLDSRLAFLEKKKKK